MRSSLSFRLAAACAAVSLLVLPACVKAKVSATLNKDGSGVATESAVMDMSKMEEIMGSMGGMMGGGEGGEGGMPDVQKELDNESDPEKIKEKLKGKKGIELVSVTRVDDPEKKTRTTEQKIKFASLEDYFRSGAEKSVSVKLEQLADGAWRFTRQIARDGDDPETGEMGAEAAGMMEMAKGMLEPFMADMEMTATYTVPGTITETNGTKSADGTSVTWTYKFANLTQKEALKQTVTFKGEGITLKAFSIKLDKEGVASDAGAPTTAPAETR
jgi:hypothetical protein